MDSKDMDKSIVCDFFGPPCRSSELFKRTLSFEEKIRVFWSCIYFYLREKCAF